MFRSWGLRWVLAIGLMWIAGCGTPDQLLHAWTGQGASTRDVVSLDGEAPRDNWTGDEAADARRDPGFAETTDIPEWRDGDEPCEPFCGERQCGLDPICRKSCGSCDDGAWCTEDVCSDAGFCSNNLLSGQCLIDGVCYPDGASDPDDACRKCAPDVQPNAWTPLRKWAECGEASRCIDGECVAWDGRCNGTPCQQVAGSISMLGCNESSACEFEAPQGSEMVFVPRGLVTFLAEQDVFGFLIDKFEATVEDYQSWLDQGAEGCLAWSASGCVPGTTGPDGECKPSALDKCNDLGRPDHPRNCIDWCSASAFCRAIGKRLCTAAEWQLAAGGSDARPYPWGRQSPNCLYAVMDDGIAGCGRLSTWPIGSRPRGASPYGALDMAGNVWEWVLDEFGTNSNIYRGGSYGVTGTYLNVSFLNYGHPTSREPVLGFRCCRSSRCSISGIEYLNGQGHPSNPCRVCDVEQSPTEWGLVKEQSVCAPPTCIGLTWKAPMTCQAGSCTGGGATTSCNDALSCTTDSCDPVSRCSHSINSDLCLIGGQCYADGAMKSGSTCETCSASNSQSSWSVMPGQCLIEGKCYQDGAMKSGSSCEVCTVSNSRTSWSIKSGWCRIDGQCFANGAMKSGSSCETCTDSNSQTSWSVKSGWCRIDGQCYSDGDMKPGSSCDMCIVLTSQYSWNIKSGWCRIDGQCFANGATNPTNSCRVCKTSTSSIYWQSVVDGTPCGTNKVCQSGSCVTAP